jgi:hypothetical protein
MGGFAICWELTFQRRFALRSTDWKPCEWHKKHRFAAGLRFVIVSQRCGQKNGGAKRW